jgi:mono/diheme cytochrome c family protein
MAAAADLPIRKLSAAAVSKRAAALLAVIMLAACGRADPSPPTPGAAIRFEQAAGVSQLDHGRRLARVLGCAGCHGANLQGQPWEEEAEFAISFSSNLTRALPAYSDAQIERALREGVRADGSPLWGMPSEIFTFLDAADVAALIAYLRTVPPGGAVHPRIHFGPRGRREVASGEYRPAPQLVRDGRALSPAGLDGRHGLARYIARSTCAECHGLTLAGQGAPPEHTPDLMAAGAYTREEFHRLMRTGVPTGGRRLTLMAQVARGRFAHFTDREVDAIYDYLVARANAAH